MWFSLTESTNENIWKYFHNIIISAFPAILAFFGGWIELYESNTDCGKSSKHTSQSPPSTGTQD